MKEEKFNLQESIRRFALEELGSDLKGRDQREEFQREDWQACAEHGIFGLNTPKHLGGSELSTLDSVEALESLGYGCPDNGLTLGINAQVWCVQAPILKFGNDFQHEKYLTSMVDGSQIGVHAMTEAEAGSDALNMKSIARKVDKGYRLTGRKQFVGLAPVADTILTFVVTNPARKKWGVTAMIVDAKSEGVTLHDSESKMGLRTIPTGAIEFQDVFVPEENVVGQEGAGASIFNASMDFERSFIFSSHVGSMARQLDETVAFAKERKLDRTPIGKHQSVSNRIADMRLRLETSRLLLHQAARLVDAGKRIPLEASMAKLHISEAFVENSLSAIRVSGGRGYMSEWGVERDLRDAVGGIIYSGTSDIQRNLIAAMLGL